MQVTDRLSFSHRSHQVPRSYQRPIGGPSQGRRSRSSPTPHRQRGPHAQPRWCSTSRPSDSLQQLIASQAIIDPSDHIFMFKKSRGWSSGGLVTSFIPSSSPALIYDTDYCISIYHHPHLYHFLPTLVYHSSGTLLIGLFLDETDLPCSPHFPFCSPSSLVAVLHFSAVRRLLWLSTLARGHRRAV